MTPSSPMGKYGILHIVNRKNNSPACSYPVDSEHTTFGRDDGCDIRLLYGWVSGLHCKLFFQNSKAFLTVYGLNGVIVDGCHIARNPDADGESSETTIPIMNNSQIEIYRKRFVFEYPSKELRAKARVEPATVKPRRTLRLSMIQSAQVFTPSKPSDTQTPKSHRRRRSETLAEQLQSPIKPFSPARPTAAATMGHETLSAADEEREVTLVGARGAQSVVVLEEEKDLVVVEAVGDDSDDEDLSDEEEIITDKENENPFDVGRSPAQSSTAPLAAPSPSPAQHSFTATIPRRAFTSPYTPNRPTLTRSSASVPAPAPPPPPVMPQAPVRTPARRARFSLHKAVLLRSAQRQLIERERLNQLQARESTIFDEDGDAEMSDMDPEFVEEPDSEPSETGGDVKVDFHLASEVKQLSVEDAEAEEEDAVEAAVSPARPRTDREANGSFSDDSERSMSEGDISLAGSEESDISEEHEQEEKSAPLGARIQTSLSSLGSFLPGLLRSPSKAVEEAEVEEDIVDQVASKNHASGPSVVKVEPEEEEDAHEVLRFGSDSDNEDEPDESETNELADTPEPEEASGSDEEDVCTPTELEAAQVDVRDGRTVKNEPADYFEDKVESTPIQPRRLNIFMTPQVARPNFPRLAAGRKSVAVATPGSAVGDVSWLPGRVPVSTQHVDSDEEEETELVLEEVVEEAPVVLAEAKKHVHELGFEEKAARRQSALAVMAAGPRQLPNRRQSVAPHLVKSEPLDTNSRRITLAATALAPVSSTPQHSSTLVQPSETVVADDSSDEEAPPEKPLDTLRKKIDYMRRQSMHRAARESPIGPLFGDMPSDSVSSDVKLEDSEEIEPGKAEDVQEPDESEQELNEESEAEAEVQTEEEEDQGVTQSEAETETETEELVVPEVSDAESETVSDHEDAQDEPEDITVVAPLPTGPSTPALKGVRALFRAAEVKGLGAQTPAGLDGMLDMFGPEFEPEPGVEAESVAEADTKPTRLRTKSANPTRLKAPTAIGMARAKSAQAASDAARSTKAPEPATSRIGARSLREPTKLPSRVQTPVEEPEPSTTRTSTRKTTTGSTVSVVIPRRAKTVKAEPSVETVEEPAPVESKIKAPSKRITRTASATTSTAESKRLTRTASSTSTDSRIARSTGRTTPVVPEEPAKPVVRSTRTKATTTSSLASRSKAAAPPARVTTPVAAAADDDQDPMDIMTMPESPTKRSTRAKAAKTEPEEDEVAHMTRSRAKSGESETAKGKRATSRRVASKATEENKENTAVDAPEVETESKVKPSGLPTKTTRKTATTSKLVAPSKTAIKAEPAAASTTARALRTRARK